jgi:hypothetical protein
MRGLKLGEASAKLGDDALKLGDACSQLRLSGAAAARPIERRGGRLPQFGIPDVRAVQVASLPLGSRHRCIACWLPAHAGSPSVTDT